MCPHLTAEQTERTNTVWIRKKKLKIENKVKKLLSKDHMNSFIPRKRNQVHGKSKIFLFHTKYPLLIARTLHAEIEINSTISSASH
jgi:hypothetical protein